MNELNLRNKLDIISNLKQTLAQS